MASWVDSYYSITVNSRGQMLYGAADGVFNDISGSADVLVSASKVSFASCSLSSSCDLSSQVKRIVNSEVVINASSLVTISSTGIFKLVSSIDASLNLNTLALKNSFGSSTILCESLVSTNPTRITFDSSSILINSNVLHIPALKILNAKILTSGLIVKVTVGKEILLAKIVLSANLTSRRIPAIRFNPNISEDTQDIRPLLVINNNPLTEHNRRINITVNQTFSEVTNWAARKSRYYRNSSNRLIFSIDWSQLPNSRDMTVDEKHGRDFIEKIGSDPKVHVLKVRNLDSDGLNPYSETEYNVIVKNYNESLIRRDLVGDTYYWNCTLELEEV